ncbi:SLT domain-containing protein [Streptomyces sp. Ag109_O5-1]|uniref:transglycosylase SLT domain-containing protein n=1 Tax=Streptomyces sp. Ag109_O5-1 TaxID=1938851 RepID=UPI000F507FC8|nr:transglycosylase SLT domain-containing protein [Streptomyces sp. Ag109_O5-1]RPE39739.1 SLT domain-containing protein [Streptomyces sp. Ag109_O5-1]
MSEGFKIASAFVEVDPETAGFKERLQEALDQAVAGVQAKVRVGLDTADLDAKADEVRARIEGLDGLHADPKVGLSTADLDAKVDEARAKLDELGARRVDPTVGLSTADLNARDDEARARLDELNGRRAQARVTLDTAEFDAKLDEARAKLDEFNGRSASARLGASGGTSGESGSSEGGLGGMIALGLGALMPGLGGAAAGLAGLAGVGALGMGQMSKALSDAHQASLNPGLTQQQLASTEQNNAVQIQQAQHTVAMAHEQAAQDAVESANSIEMAQMNLAQTERSAAEHQIQALQSVRQAQQGVEEADYNLSEAQYNLTQAWEAAREQIRQLDDQLSDSKLNVQQAELAIQQAEYQQRLVNQNAYSTSLDRQQAALNVTKAQQQLKDAQDQETAAAYQANLAHKNGVEHSQTVIQAKQAVTAATYGVQDAHFSLADAQRQQTLTQLNSAAQIKEAQMQLAMAEEQAAYQRKRDAEQVQFAEQTLTNTIKSQQLAWAAMMSTENEAANQFRKDMSLMSPVAQQVVEKILSMSGEFKGLRTAAQDAMAPGQLKFLDGLDDLMPTLKKETTKIGGFLGDAFAAIGKELSKPEFAHVLDGLIDNGLEFAKIVGPAFGDFAGALAKIGSQKGAADGLGNLLAGIGKSLAGMATEVGKYTPEINDFLSAAGVIIAQIGPPLGQIVGLVAQVFEPLAKYLNAHPDGTTAKVLGDILAGMLSFRGLRSIVSAPWGAIKSGYESVKGIPAGVKDVAAKIAAPFGRGGVWDGIRARGMYAADGIRAGWGKTTTFFTDTLPTAAGRGWTKLTEGATRAGQLVSRGLSTSADFFTDTLPSALSRGGTALKTWATNGASAVAQWGSRVGSTMASAASSVGEFVAGFGRQMVTAMRATGVWIAEQTTAAATFIAENVAEATAATVAFIAENLATLGIVAGIGLLVAAILFLADNWKTVWKDIEIAALWLWHNVLDPFWQGLEQGAEWLWSNGLKPFFAALGDSFTSLENIVLWCWHHIFEPFFSTVADGARQFVSGFKDIWSELRAIFSDPVKFLVNTVYDDGIAALWNDVVGALGMKSLKLPVLKFATGGVVDGYAPGKDTVPAMLSPGEGVLVPEAVRAIGPDTVHALNATYGGGRSSDAGHFSGGGIIGDIESAAGSVLGKAGKIAKLVADVSTGDTSGLTKDLESFVSTKAVGNYAKLLLGVPKALIKDAVKSVTDAFSSGSSSGGSVGGTIPSGQHKSVIDQALKAAGAPPPGTKAQWEAGLNTLITRESGWNPKAINLTDINAKNGDPSRGLAQTIMSTFKAYHAPGTSWDIYDPVANVASAINYIVSRYHNITNVQQANANMPPKGYDSGGWLMPSNVPGNNVGVNMLGKPEAVLTPEQSEAFVQMVALLTSQQGGGGTALGTKTAVINFNGTQYPNTEQLAAIQREMGLALSGV